MLLFTGCGLPVMTSSTTIKVGGVVFTGKKSVELHLSDCFAPQLREIYEDLGGYGKIFRFTS